VAHTNEGNSCSNEDRKGTGGREGIPGAMSASKKNEALEMAYRTLILHLGDKVMREVSKEKTAAGIWSKLESLYMTKSLSNRIHLKGRLFGFKIAEDKPISDSLDEFNRIVIDLENIDVKIDDEDQAVMILNALPKNYSNFVEAMKYARESLTLEEVQAALKSKELDSKSEKKPIGEGLNIRGKPRKNSKSNSKNQSKNKASEGKDQKNGEEKEFPYKCYHCHKEGHMKKDCPDKDKTFSKPKKQANATVAETGYDSAEALNISHQDSSQSWVLDSGCTYHMSPNKSWFEDLKIEHGGSVLLGNNKACKVISTGNIRIKMFDGIERVLDNVRFIPELKRNLISLGTLDEQGYNFHSENGNLFVSKDSVKVMKGTRINGLYFLVGSTVVGSANAVDRENNSRLWHLRLGHVSEKGMNVLEKQGCFGQSKLGKLEFCEDCIYGKASRASFNKAVHRTEAILDYIHSDLWGPAKVTSHGGNRYYMSFIDDYSRRVWVYLLKHKSDAFETFKDWKTMVENQTGKQIKKLRTYNGLEYCADVFNEFCRKTGIQRHHTVVHTPQQNGLAERFNRTIMERVRCMLNHARLPQSFWAEAVKTACYLINRCPSTAIDLKTPMQMWSDHKTDYTKLKVFGCTTYVHIKQGKLEPRALKCIFIGYPDGVKGYKLWCLEPGHKRCMISRDVTFNESDFQNRKSDDKIWPLSENEAPETTQVQVELGETSTGQAPQEDTEPGGVVEDTEEPAEACSPRQGVEAQTQGSENISDYNLVRDRNRRVPKPTQHFGYDLTAYAFMTGSTLLEEEPRTYTEACKSSHCKQWKSAMLEEIDSLKENKTWSIVDKPEGHKIIGSKWIFKLKDGIPGVEEPRFKARLVAKGYSQTEGIDYNEIYSPVVKHRSIRTILALCAHFDWELDQMDVKTAFLYGDLEEQIFMQQPEGFEVGSKGEKVCLLHKSLYGLKQSPRQWYLKFDEFMISHGYQRSEYDWCVYFKDLKISGFIYLLLYVDDMLLVCKEKSDLNRLKAQLNQRFKMKDLGPAKKILGMEIIRDRKNKKLCLYQQSYLGKVLDRYEMSLSKTVTTPIPQHYKLSSAQSPQSQEEILDMARIPYASAVGSLMFAMICSRPDLAYAISLVSRFMSNPGKEHWNAVKWVLRYLKGTLKHGVIWLL